LFNATRGDSYRVSDYATSTEAAFGGVVIRKTVLLLATLVLSACGSIRYVPEDSAIAASRISGLAVNGEVSFVNAQPDHDEKILYRSPTSSVKWVADYHLVAEKLVGQLNREIGKNLRSASSGATKKIQVRVDDLHVENKVAFYIGRLTATVILDNGSTITKRSVHGSPGNVWHVLNRAVATGVVDILNDPAVRNYLAK